MKHQYGYKFLLAFLSLIFFSYRIYAQNGQDQTFSLGTRIIPPSPNAAALGRYGNTPVGLHTGIPEINIPLYTIKSKILEVPISLSYHASGIKVDEMASWVGLGWSLNAGGVITRSVVGLSDEGGFWSRTIKKASQITSSDLDYVRGIANGQIDGESDYYFYNFNGHAGKFVYAENNLNKPLLIPVSPIKVKYNPQGWFEVIDETGTFYKFAAVEYMESGSPAEYRPLFKSSFYLSEIISADGSDKIQFKYAVDAYYSETNTTYTETVGLKCNEGSNRTKSPYQKPDRSYTIREIHPIRLKEILYANGKVEFVEDGNRSDAPTSRLGAIKISSINPDGTYSLQRKFILGEGYFVSPAPVVLNDYRLKLTEVTEKDSKENTIKKHSFSYNESIKLPTRLSTAVYGSLAQDWWGFYNGKTGNQSLIPSETITNYGGPYYVGNGSREPDETAMKACILNKIVYPTGGYTEFYYEPHYYSSGTKKMAGGLRVQEVRDYEKSGAMAVTKVYKYGLAENGMGTLLIPTNGLSASKQEIDTDYYYQSPDNQNATCMISCQSIKLVISGRAVHELSTLNGAPVVYPEVAVYEGSISAPNGKQVFKFDVQEDTFFGIPTKAYNNGTFQVNESWRGGDQIWNGVFVGNSPDPIKETNSEYSILSDVVAYGTKIGYRKERQGCTIYQPSLDPFYYFDYPIYSGIKKLTYREEIQKDAADKTKFVSSQTEYKYENLGEQHQQLTRQITTTSQEKTLETKYWYPADYDSTSVQNIASLLRKNIISTPIKIEQHQNQKLISGKVNRLNTYGKPDEVYIYESGTLQAPPGHEKNKIIPSGYVKKMNIGYHTLTKNTQNIRLSQNIDMAYLWGYNQTLPIAEIKNAHNQLVHSRQAFPASGQITYSPGTAAPGPVSFTSATAGTISLNINFGGNPGSSTATYSYSLRGAASRDGTLCVSSVSGCSYPSTVNFTNLPAGSYTLTTAYVNSNATTNINITYSYPSTRVVTSGTIEFYYENFEEDNNASEARAHTGKKGNNGRSFTVNFTKPNSRQHLITWHQWDATKGSWDYKEEPYTGLKTFASSLFIDDIRVYPVDAQMTTYTYDPLNGMTSSTDARGITTYYEYDDLGRLLTIQDDKQNVLKKYEYRYAHQ